MSSSPLPSLSSLAIESFPLPQSTKKPSSQASQQDVVEIDAELPIQQPKATDTPATQPVSTLDAQAGFNDAYECPFVIGCTGFSIQVSDELPLNTNLAWVGNSVKHIVLKTGSKKGDFVVYSAIRLTKDYDRNDADNKRFFYSQLIEEFSHSDPVLLLTADAVPPCTVTLAYNKDAKEMRYSSCGIKINTGHVIPLCTVTTPEKQEPQITATSSRGKACTLAEALESLGTHESIMRPPTSTDSSSYYKKVSSEARESCSYSIRCPLPPPPQRKPLLQRLFGSTFGTFLTICGILIASLWFFSIIIEGIAAVSRGNRDRRNSTAASSGIKHGDRVTVRPIGPARQYLVDY